MSDDELEKLAAEMKNIRASDAARERGMAAAMAAFDAEFAVEAAQENLSASQGLADDARPTDQTTRDGRAARLGRDAMSKLKEIFTLSPKTMLMAGTCAAALFATSLYVPNMRFEDVAVKTAPEAVTAEVGANVAETEEVKEAEADNVAVTGRQATTLETASQSVSKNDILQRQASGSNSNPTSLEEDFKRNSLKDLLSETTPEILLDKAKSDTATAQAAHKNREVRFRVRRDQRAKLYENVTGEKMPTDNDQTIREYRATLQQKDNISLFVDQRDIYKLAEAAKEAAQQNAQAAPPPPMIERQQAAKSTERITSLEGAIAEFEAPKLVTETPSPYCASHLSYHRALISQVTVACDMM